MIRHALILGAASFALMFRDPGCGEDSSSNGVNAPCERDPDCQAGLTCQGGACIGPAIDAGASGDAEAGARDSSGDG